MLTVAAGSSPLTCAPGTSSSRDAIGDQPHFQYSERTRSGHPQGDGPTLDDTFLGPVEPSYIVGPSPQASTSGHPHPQATPSRPPASPGHPPPQATPSRPPASPGHPAQATRKGWPYYTRTVPQARVV